MEMILPTEADTSRTIRRRRGDRSEPTSSERTLRRFAESTAGATTDAINLMF
jgi:hypothetical protein